MNYTLYYSDSKEPHVVPAGTEIPGDVDAFLIREESDLLTVPGPTLVRLYNAGSSSGVVKKFTDKATAARRVFPLLGHLVPASMRVSEPEDVPTPVPGDKKNSSVKGKRLGVSKLIAERLLAGDVPDAIVKRLREEIPLSRAGKKEVAWVRNQLSKGREFK